MCFERERERETENQENVEQQRKKVWKERERIDRKDNNN